MDDLAVDFVPEPSGPAVENGYLLLSLQKTHWFATMTLPDRVGKVDTSATYVPPWGRELIIAFPLDESAGDVPRGAVHVDHFKAVLAQVVTARSMVDSYMKMEFE